MILLVETLFAFVVLARAEVRIKIWKPLELGSLNGIAYEPTGGDEAHVHGGVA